MLRDGKRLRETTVVGLSPEAIRPTGAAYAPGAHTACRAPHGAMQRIVHTTHPAVHLRSFGGHFCALSTHTAMQGVTTHIQPPRPLRGIVFAPITPYRPRGSFSQICSIIRTVFGAMPLGEVWGRAPAAEPQLNRNDARGPMSPRPCKTSLCVVACLFVCTMHTARGGPPWDYMSIQAKKC